MFTSRPIKGNIQYDLDRFIIEGHCIQSAREDNHQLILNQRSEWGHRGLPRVNFQQWRSCEKCKLLNTYDHKVQKSWKPPSVAAQNPSRSNSYFVTLALVTPKECNQHIFLQISYIWYTSIGIHAWVLRTWQFFDLKWQFSDYTLSAGKIGHVDSWKSQ